MCPPSPPGRRWPLRAVPCAIPALSPISQPNLMLGETSGGSPPFSEIPYIKSVVENDGEKRLGKRLFFMFFSNAGLICCPCKCFIMLLRLCWKHLGTRCSSTEDCSFCLQGYFAPENSTECTPCPLLLGLIQSLQRTWDNQRLLHVHGWQIDHKTYNVSSYFLGVRNEMAPLPRTGQCSPCGPGFITRHVASTSCFRCKVGTYRLNETQCVKCPGRKTTAYQGAATIEECVCPAETYLADGLRDEMDQHLPSGSCVDCGEGLTCGLGSDMRHFEDFMKGKGQHGDAEDGEDQMDQSYPLVQAGYFARTGELTSVFRCGAVIDCPGGLPGTCAAGRTGALCGHCEAGWKTSSDGCETWMIYQFTLVI